MESQCTYDGDLYDHLRDDHGWNVSVWPRDDLAMLRAAHQVSIEQETRDGLIEQRDALYAQLQENDAAIEATSARMTHAVREYVHLDNELGR